MNTAVKLIKNKVGVLKLAEELGNVSHACKLVGYILAISCPRRH
jgi:hypothetical protein